ncbi:hypothetical protein [Oryza sativa Japonica Group]|uniref:Uncharacterized protein n=1 Tax=Oryza sativa subsp. japonica TaxID=39947 RepID=Q5NB29_ORYSJ|nr:hypothetical protein [Oryza sativa Japonica Group]BAD81327.1 hypothetical protein [Oryza sativa Japonica Group]
MSASLLPSSLSLGFLDTIDLNGGRAVSLDTSNIYGFLATIAPAAAHTTPRPPPRLPPPPQMRRHGGGHPVSSSSSSPMLGYMSRRPEGQHDEQWPAGKRDSAPTWKMPPPPPLGAKIWRLAARRHWEPGGLLPGALCSADLAAGEDATVSRWWGAEQATSGVEDGWRDGKLVLAGSPPLFLTSVFLIGRHLPRPPPRQPPPTCLSTGW